MSKNETVQERLVGIAARALKQTLSGRLVWQTTDDENAFVYAGDSTSLLVRNSRGRIFFSVLNGRGTTIGSIDTAQALAIDAPGFSSWEELLDHLYDATRRSALNIDELLDETIRELSTDDDE